MSLTDALNNFAKTDKFKSMVGAARNQAAAKGKSFGTVAGKGGGGSNSPQYYAAEAKAILTEKIEEAGFEYGDYLRVEEAVWDPTLQKWVVELRFDADPSKIHRSSLYPKKYPKGADDIVALMNHGYHAKKRAFGYWDKAGARVLGLQHREGAFFIQSAAMDFNAKFEGEAIMDWNPKYDPIHGEHVYEEEDGEK